MKPFRYRFSKLLNPVIMNRSGTNIRINGIYSKGTFLLNIPPGKVEYVEIPVLTENEISTPEEAANAATVEMKTVKAYTFFCVAGTEFAEGGDGSESNPWASVNYALNQLQPIVDCFIKTYCCEYIQLRCSGVCNYEVHNIEKAIWGNWSSFDGKNRFILSGLNVEIDFEDSQTFEDSQDLGTFDSVQVEYEKKAISGVRNTIFLFSKASVSVATEAFSNRENSSVYCSARTMGFDGCSGIFYLCEANVNCSSISNGKNSGGGMSSHSKADAYGFRQCDGTFIEAKSNANASGEAISRIEDDQEKVSEGNASGYSFYSCTGNFYSCTGKGIGISKGTTGRQLYYAAHSEGIGFSVCIGNFYSCTGYGEAAANALNNLSRGIVKVVAYGFLSCSDSFYFCNSESDASGTGYACEVESFGFYSFHGNNNILISCSANAKSVASGQEYLYRACGFLNCNADFYDCSSSERICESNGTYETNCENFECDI